MRSMNRRQLLYATGLGLTGAAVARAGGLPTPSGDVSDHEHGKRQAKPLDTNREVCSRCGRRMWRDRAFR